MPLQYNPYELPLIFIGIESVALGLVVWRRDPDQRGALPFALLMLGVAFWSLGYALEMAFTTLAPKIFCVKIEYLGIASIPILFLLFAVDYTGHRPWLTTRNVVLLSIVPTLTVLLMFTNELHGLVYSQIALDDTGSFPNFDGTWGPWFWVHSAYSYIAMLLAVGLIVLALVRSPQLYQGQAITLLIAGFAPWVGNALHLSGLDPFPNLDLTPFAFAISGVALAWSLARFRLLDIVPAARDEVFESMDDALIVLDAQNRVVDLNPAAQSVLGPEASTAIGRPFGELIPERTDLIERFRDVRQIRTEITFAWAGADHVFDLRISPLRDWRGAFTGRLIVLRDMTEVKLIEKKLAEAHDQALEALRMKSRILAIVSHDLRTPMGSILGFAEMLRDGVYGSLADKQHRPIERIISSVGDLTGLVNDLLDQAQLDAGKITIHFSQFPPAKLVDNIEAALGPKARQKGLKLTLEIAQGVPGTVRSDLSRLNQIVNNLVGNAIKFTPQGEVKLRIFMPDLDHWACEVSDTGPGIAPADQEHVFDSFWQVDSPQTREHGGAGLGLSIAKQLANRLGGTIALQSELGKGSKFVVTLPLDPMREALHEKALGTDH